jgi:hypothetical protein
MAKGSERGGLMKSVSMFLIFISILTSNVAASEKKAVEKKAMSQFSRLINIIGYPMLLDIDHKLAVSAACRFCDKKGFSDSVISGLEQYVYGAIEKYALDPQPGSPSEFDKLTRSYIENPEKRQLLTDVIYFSMRMYMSGYYEALSHNKSLLRKDDFFCQYAIEKADDFLTRPLESPKTSKWPAKAD